MGAFETTLKFKETKMAISAGNASTDRQSIQAMLR